MNSVNLMGRLTADPELKSTQTGIEVCSFMIAINRQVAKDKEKVADFIPCTAWGKTGVFANTYFHRGDMIAIEGSLQSRKYADKEGKNHTAYDVRVDKILLSAVGSPSFRITEIHRPIIRRAILHHQLRTSKHYPVTMICRSERNNI